MTMRIKSHQYPLVFVLLAVVLVLAVACTEAGSEADTLGGRLLEPPPFAQRPR